jgi:exopolysaccharide biosynthesis protein
MHILCILFFIGYISSVSCSAHQELAKPSLEPEIEDGNFNYQIVRYLQQKIHLVKIIPDHFNISLFKEDRLLIKPSEVAKQKRAVLVINAGFFEKDGRPAGALKIGGKWHRKPIKNRGVVGWSLGNKFFYFDRLTTDDGAVSSGLLTKGQNEHDWWNEVDFLVGGAPLLLYDGKLLDLKPEKTLESFMNRRYARTAICLTQEQELAFIVVEGGDRISWSLGFRNGLNLFELSDFLQQIRCEKALNLDGGKSSTMVLKGQIVNAFPLFSSEREVSDVIYVTR